MHETSTYTGRLLISGSDLFHTKEGQKIKPKTEFFRGNRVKTDRVLVYTDYSSTSKQCDVIRVKHCVARKLLHVLYRMRSLLFGIQLHSVLYFSLSF